MIWLSPEIVIHCQTHDGQIFLEKNIKIDAAGPDHITHNANWSHVWLEIQVYYASSG